MDYQPSNNIIEEHTTEEQHNAERTGAGVFHEDEEIQYLTHITLNTGQTRRIYPGEVDKKLYAAMKRVWKDSFKSKGVQLFEAYRFVSLRTRLATIGTVYDGKGMPIITATFSPWDDGRVWRSLQGSPYIPIATKPNDSPPAPYVADQWENGFMQHEDAAAWTEDFSRCFGWLALDPGQIILEGQGDEAPRQDGQESLVASSPVYSSSNRSSI